MSNYYLTSPKKTGLAGWTDTVKNIGGSVFSVFQAGEQAKGAAAAMQAQAAANAGLSQGGGLPMTTILLLGGVGLGAFLLLRKKKPATP